MDAANVLVPHRPRHPVPRRPRRLCPFVEMALLNLAKPVMMETLPTAIAVVQLVLVKRHRQR